MVYHDVYETNTNKQNTNCEINNINAEHVELNLYGSYVFLNVRLSFIHRVVFTY